MFIPNNAAIGVGIQNNLADGGITLHCCDSRPHQTVDDGISRPGTGVGFQTPLGDCFNGCIGELELAAIQVPEIIPIPLVQTAGACGQQLPVILHSQFGNGQDRADSSKDFRGETILLQVLNGHIQDGVCRGYRLADIAAEADPDGLGSLPNNVLQTVERTTKNDGKAAGINVFGFFFKLNGDGSTVEQLENVHGGVALVIVGTPGVELVKFIEKDQAPGKFAVIPEILFDGAQAVAEGNSFPALCGEGGTVDGDGVLVQDLRHLAEDVGLALTRRGHDECGGRREIVGGNTVVDQLVAVDVHGEDRCQGPGIALLAGERSDTPQRLLQDPLCRDGSVVSLCHNVFVLSNVLKPFFDSYNPVKEA